MTARAARPNPKALTGLLALLLAGALAVAAPAGPAAAAPPSTTPAAPAADQATAQAEPSKEADRLRKQAAELRTRMDEQHRRLEVLSEELSAARDRGKQLLLGTGEMDRRWESAARGLAEARADLDLRMGALQSATPDYWSAMRAGPGPALRASAQMRRRQLDVTEGRERVGRAEAAMATAELERDQLSGSLVAQANEAERLHDVEQEAETLAASLQTELRRMDRRIAALIEEERRREEEAARASFMAWAARDGGAAAASADLPAAGAVRRAIEVAMSQRGKPYLWGAEGPSRFDCSGLMQYSYAAAGISIPRVSRDQYAAFAARRPIPMRDLRPGDLVFFADRPSDPRTIHHVGMYIGSGLMVEAPYTGAFVRTSSIMRSSYAGAVRPVA
jgi:cell wall-associated NlpC family hydrolase